MADFDIDLVYCWCNGNDPAFLAEKDRWAAREGQSVTVPGAAACRFIDNGELRYSIRSARRYAPWIRKIHVLVNDGCSLPAWLVSLQARGEVVVVRHSDIIPKEYLPTFNAIAIEFFLSLIPDLAEHFLCANDDTFFNRPVQPDFFFTSEGWPICRYLPDKLSEGLAAEPTNIWYRQLANCRDLMREHFPDSPGWRAAEDVILHHNIDAYLKSEFVRFAARFPEAFEKSTRPRFRSPTQLCRDVMALIGLAEGRAVFRLVRRAAWRVFLGAAGCDSLIVTLYAPRGISAIRRLKPVLFCLNDTESCTDEHRMRARRFLEQKFGA